MNRNPTPVTAPTIVARNAWMAIEATLLALIPLALPFSFPVMGKARHGTAKYDLANLASAITGYHREYNRLPLEGTGTSDYTLEASGEIITILSAEDPHERNSRRISFYEAPLSRKDGSGGQVKPDGMTEVRDPWGRPYKIVLDQSGDGVVTSPKDGTPVRTCVLVYSAGPDRNYDTWKDNLASWE